MRTVRVDLNSPGVVREDGVEEITAAYVEGMELREQVRIEDDNWFAYGFISAIKDYGRGRFVTIEVK